MFTRDVLQQLFFIFLSSYLVETFSNYEINQNQNHYHQHQQRHQKHDSNLLSVQQSKNNNGEWATVLRAVASERSPAPSKCVGIPKNFSLCYGIQVFKMII